jgi:23S rRNA pseudouridine1911/1915/1917 synthase
MPEIDIKFTIDEQHHGLRIDQALSQLMPMYSRSMIQQWLNAGDILLNEQAVKAKTKIQTGDHVLVQVSPMTNHETWQAQALPLDIVHEDDSLLIINKAVGMVVHPGAGNPDRTLLNALLYHDPALSQLPRAGIIHRIDKDTSGLLVVARSLTAYHTLSQAMQERRITRTYLTIVNGTLLTGGTIAKNIARHPKVRTKMSVTANGKPAITHYRIKERYRTQTYLEVTLETGRTHQIRVHMSAIGHPIVGDKHYGARPFLPKHCSPELKQQLTTFPRQALHAHALSLQHPTKHEHVCWEAPLPDDMCALIAALEKDNAAHA